jgi:transaldolase
MNLIADICAIYKQYEALETQVLVASVRNLQHITDAAKLGAHVATIPPKVIKEMIHHPLTDKGLATFLEDWKKTGQKIA